MMRMVCCILILITLMPKELLRWVAEDGWWYNLSFWNRDRTWDYFLAFRATCLTFGRLMVTLTLALLASQVSDMAWMGQDMTVTSVKVMMVAGTKLVFTTLALMALLRDHSLVLWAWYLGVITAFDLRSVVEPWVVGAYRLIVLTFWSSQNRWRIFDTLITQDHLIVTQWRIIELWYVFREVLILHTSLDLTEIQFGYFGTRLWLILGLQASGFLVLLSARYGSFAGLLTFHCSNRFRIHLNWVVNNFIFFVIKCWSLWQILLRIEVRDDSTCRLAVSTTLIIFFFNTWELVVESGRELLASLG